MYLKVISIHNKLKGWIWDSETPCCSARVSGSERAHSTVHLLQQPALFLNYCLWTILSVTLNSAGVYLLQSTHPSSIHTFHLYYFLFSVHWRWDLYSWRWNVEKIPLSGWTEYWIRFHRWVGIEICLRRDVLCKYSKNISEPWRKKFY